MYRVSPLFSRSLVMGMIASTDACRVAKRSARGGKGNRRCAQTEVQVHAKEQ
jgi:hypothetical protein